MKEEITKLLNDENFNNLESVEAKVDAITSALGPLVFPKDKFNNLNNEYKALETKYSTLENDFENFKQSKMTNDEKAKAEKEKFEADKKAVALDNSRVAVKELFLDNGIKISDDTPEYKDLLTNIVSEDKDKSINLAQQFINVLGKTKEQASKETTANLLNNTPTPVVGQSTPVDKVAEYQKQLDTAIKSGDQVQIATITRLIQEEKQKQL